MGRRDHKQSLEIIAMCHRVENELVLTRKKTSFITRILLFLGPIPITLNISVKNFLCVE